MKRRNIFRILSWGLLLLSVASCMRHGRDEIDISLKFGAEKLTKDGKNMYADNDSAYVFKNAKFRTTEIRRTGDYSIITSPSNRFAMSVAFRDVRPEDHVSVSVWRKGTGNKAHLVATSPDPDMFYKIMSVGERKENGWEELKLDFFLPPNYNDHTLKIYVWNNSSDTVYFDDLSVRITSRITYPVYNEPAFHIETDTSEYLRLLKIRERAFDAGILKTTDDDWVKGFVFVDDKMMKTKLRLKGDWLDHLHGTKWSFRLKLKKPGMWNGMKTFSVQSPVARHGVDEWFLHQVMFDESILATRYGFTPLEFNHRNLGFYAWEEHFNKQLIESQQKREGPIVRFLEDAHWDQVEGRKAGIENIALPAFEAAVVKPFGTSKIVKDTGLFHQYLIAQNLMWQYKHRLKTASEIFNIDVLARFYAFVDVFSAYHSIIWHNQRFYYNPVLCKLEPVMFDAYTEEGFYDWVTDRALYGDITSDAVGTVDDEYLMMRELFNDDTFLNAYVKYLAEYSSAEFLQQITDKYQDKASYYDSLIRIEFPWLKLDIPHLYENVENIRKELPAFRQKVAEREKEHKKWRNVSKTEKQYTKGLEGRYAKNFVVAYVMQRKGDSLRIRVTNYFPDPVLLLGVGKSDKKIRGFIHPEPELKGYRYDAPDHFEFWTEWNEPNYLFFMAGNSKTVTTGIYPWPEPDGSNTPLQELEANNLFPIPEIMEVTDDNRVLFKSGKHTLNQPLIIPAGYRVYIEAGTTIDLTDSAMLISYAPLFINGTEKDPVVFTSSDFTGNGVAVLQAGGKSKISYATFENLNTIDYKGWTLTGAVTFYESDVDMDHVLFYRNQCEDALNTIRSDFKLENSTFDHIYGDAFDSDFCTGLVKDTRFNSIGNDAIDFSGSHITITGTEITEASDKGISGGEGSHLIVKNTTITRSNIGLASKDLSVIDVQNSTVTDCNYGIVLLQKKPEYGPARMSLTNTTVSNAKTSYLIETGSEVVIDGKLMKGDRKDLAKLFY